MKLHVLSDLHIEFHDFAPPETDADVVVLAGDIGIGADGVAWAAERFPDRPVLYVPGNHEYYDHDIGFTADLKAGAPDNVRVLECDRVVIDGTRLLGCTLWTDFLFYGEADAWLARQRAKESMLDFESIRNGRQRFTPEHSVLLHERSRAWLEQELADGFDGPTVVITHHLPAARSVSERYYNDPLNPGFVSRLEELIDAHRPALWIHGHTHVPCDYELSGTRVVCNPRGYPREAGESDFRPDLVVSIP